jgi:hypothetical protein
MKAEEFRPYLMRLTKEQRVSFLSDLKQLIEKLEQEEAARLAAPKYMGFYSLLHYETRRTYNIDYERFPAFCREHKLSQEKMLAVALGEEREYKGWLRGSNINAHGKPYKEPRLIDPSVEVERKAQKKRTLFLDSTRYTVPPASTTVEYIPAESEN